MQTPNVMKYTTWFTLSRKESTWNRPPGKEISYSKETFYVIPDLAVYGQIEMTSETIWLT